MFETFKYWHLEFVSNFDIRIFRGGDRHALRARDDKVKMKT